MRGRAVADPWARDRRSGEAAKALAIPRREPSRPRVENAAPILGKRVFSCISAPKIAITIAKAGGRNTLNSLKTRHRHSRKRVPMRTDAHFGVLFVPGILGRAGGEGLDVDLGGVIAGESHDTSGRPSHRDRGDLTSPRKRDVIPRRGYPRVVDLVRIHRSGRRPRIGLASGSSTSGWPTQPSPSLTPCVGTCPGPSGEISCPQPGSGVMSASLVEGHIGPGTE